MRLKGELFLDSVTRIQIEPLATGEAATSSRQHAAARTGVSN